MSDQLADRLRQLVDQQAPPLELNDLTDQMLGGSGRSRPHLAWVLTGSVVGALAIGVIVFVNAFDPEPAVSPSLAPPITGPTTVPPPTVPTTTTVTSVVESLRPRDIDPALARSPDWVEIAAAPIDLRFMDSGITAWTGSEIVMWGGGTTGFAAGASYNPTTGQWRLMAESPFAEGTVARFPGWVWTGAELVVWTGGEVATWDPVTNRWRSLGQVPLAAQSFHRRAVWTGSEIIDTVANIAFDPTTGLWRQIASPNLRGGMLEERSQAVWTGNRLILLPRGPGYDPETDRWDPIEDSGLSVNSVDGAFVGGVVVAVDYHLDAALYDVEADRWLSTDPVPLQPMECPIAVLGVDDRAVVDYCGQWAVYDGTSWVAFTGPDLATEEGIRLIGAGTDLYTFGDQLWQFVPQLTDPWNTIRRVTTGGLAIDLPQGWVSEPAMTPHELLRTRTDSGRSCMVARFGGGQVAVDAFTEMGATSVVVEPRVGGTPYEAIGAAGGHPDFPMTLMWVPPGEPFTFNCATLEEATTLFAHAIWIWELPEE